MVTVSAYIGLVLPSMADEGIEGFAAPNQSRELRNAADFSITEPLVPRSPGEGNERPLVINMENEEPWRKFAAVVFQGLVNRKAARIYLIWDNSDVFWREKFVEMEYIQEIETVNTDELPELAARSFPDSFDGLLVYDENVLTTDGVEAVLVNVITAIAGKERLIPVPAERVKEWDLPVRFDVRGRWESVDAAYQWLLSKYPDFASRGTIAHLHPKILRIRDYMAAFNVLPLFYWVGMSDETKDLFEDILYSTGPNQPVIGLWHVAHHQGLADPAGITAENCEHSFVRHISSFGKYLIVIERMANLTYHSSLSLKETTFRKRAGKPPVELEQKVYITFLVSDGDNIWYITKGDAFPGPRWWGNSHRGEVPVAWTIAPVLADLMPGTLSYFYRTATENDSFLAAMGLDYIFMDHYATRYENRDEILREYFTAVGKYMKKIDIKGAWLWHDVHLQDPIEPGRGLEELMIASQANPQLEVIFADYSRRPKVTYEKANFMVNDVPVFHALTMGGLDAKKMADEVREQTPSDVRPAFMHIFAVNWVHNPATLAELASELGPEYVVVGPETLGELYKTSLRSSK